MASFTQPFVLSSGESPSGTLVTSSSQTISASQTTGVASASGPWDTWAITSDQKVSRNGTADANTSGVTKLYYTNHTLYQFNGTFWWYFNTARSTSTTFSWVNATDPTVTAVADVWDPNHKATNISLSANGLTATLTVATGTDEPFFAKETTSAGANCSLLYWEVVLTSPNTNGQAGIGTDAAGTANGTYLGSNTATVGWLGSSGAVAYNNGSSTTWATYTSGSRLCFALDLVNGKLWGRVGNGNWNNGLISAQNPATNLGGYAIPASIYVAGTSPYVVPAVSLWANNDTAVASFERASWVNAPPVGFGPWSGALPVAAPVFQSIVLTGSKAFTTGTTDAVVGTIAVTMSSGSFSGTLQTGGADATSFKIVNVSGVFTLETNGSLSTAKTYTVNIVATQNGISNSPFTGPSESIVGSAAGTLTAPTQASNAGFSTLVFADDFTTSNTINPGSNLPAGSKWCWGRSGVSTSIYTVNTTATAASVNNGNSGGGSNASPSGGILNLTGIAGNIGDVGLLSTAPGNTTTAVTGTFFHGYFECYMQFNAQGSSSSGWPGFWWWSVQNNTSAEGLEVDILEYSGAGDNVTPFTGGPYVSATNFHEWGGAGASRSISLGNQDSNWHTFGVLWTGNGTTGTISTYKDNVLIGSVATGSGTVFPAAESIQVYINLSAGLGWPINVDWVRIWQR